MTHKQAFTTITLPLAGRAEVDAAGEGGIPAVFAAHGWIPLVTARGIVANDPAVVREATADVFLILPGHAPGFQQAVSVPKSELPALQAALAEILARPPIDARTGLPVGGEQKWKS